MIGGFGFDANKRIPQLLERSRSSVCGIRARACSSSGRRRRDRLEERIDRLGLADAVERRSYVDERWSLLAACEVCVSLRWPTMGETSAGVIRMLSLAKPIVVSDVDAFAELPTGRGRIAPDEREVDALVASLLQLVEDPSLGARMSAAAREFALREHDGASRRPLHLGARGGRGQRGGSRRAAARGGSRSRGRRRLRHARGGGGTPRGPGLARPSARARRGAGARARPRSRGAGLGGRDRRRVDGRSLAFAQRIAAPWIVVDELIYSELARSVAAKGGC